jgi:hypothetical protein
MPHPSKSKGNRYERELVNQALQSGIDAKRAPGSNGEAIGEHAEVDLIVGGYRGQAKIRKAIAGYITPSENVDFQVLRENNGTSYCVIEWWNFLDLLKAAGITSNGPCNDKVD